jgi:hypothetical protein
MRKIYAVLTIMSLFVAQQAFADAGDFSSKNCKKVADSCMSAGKQGKAFWEECMQPILLNHAVKGVTVDASDVVACREFKIKKMQTELEQLQQAQGK